jgi:small subunit ribosomal protein S1
VMQRFGVDAVIEGPVTSLTNFGAFVQLAEGVEGMIHVSEISAEKRIKHPQEVLQVGQVVKAQVLAIDKDRRLLRLGMKQLVPTSLDEYIAEHKEGDVVTGRMIEISDGQARVELGEGIQGTCPIVAQGPAKEETRAESKADLSALSSMLKARWKGGAGGAAKPENIHAGQIRSFRIAKLDAVSKKIELQIAE